MLPKEAILEYQEIYKRLYDVELTLEQATDYAMKLFSFVELVTKPIQK